ncbi:DUF6318 family protein [Nocardioides alcanivorans]|uniref:DUF6318 family protein n=1 Tax=Nocardioides alcanivorans TaxID=2897352 RepID=UPI001F3C9D5C|nr:DUF6318 family protein [Nocardioides alcanivorans]
MQRRPGGDGPGDEHGQVSAGSSDAATATDVPQPRVGVLRGARSATPAGAKAYAAHWVELLNQAVARGTGEWLRESGPDCVTCRRMADGIDGLTETGGHVTGEGWLLQRVVAQPGLPDKQAELGLEVLRRPEAIVASEGADPEYREGGNERYLMKLEHDGTTWHVIELAPVLR